MKSFSLVVALLLLGCNSQENRVKYDGKKLLEQKCKKCHNLEMPPFTSQDETAPPMMAVAFHVHSFVKPKNESQRTPMAIAFVKDYVQNPALDKSFCDKESLRRYGLMPSQKGELTIDETEAIASYVFSHYTPKNLLKIQKEKAEFDKLSDGEKLAIKYKCIACHKIEVDTVGPSLKAIAKRYENSSEKIEQSIKNGSRKKWGKRIMPAFKELSKEEFQTLSDWVLEKGEATEKK